MSFSSRNQSSSTMPAMPASLGENPRKGGASCASPPSLDEGSASNMSSFKDSFKEASVGSVSDEQKRWMCQQQQQQGVQQRAATARGVSAAAHGTWITLDWSQIADSEGGGEVGFFCATPADRTRDLPISPPLLNLLLN